MPDHRMSAEEREFSNSTMMVREDRRDVDPRAFAIAGAYTPVPGGVGALTIAMLMANTVKAARFRRGL